MNQMHLSLPAIIAHLGLHSLCFFFCLPHSCSLYKLPPLWIPSGPGGCELPWRASQWLPQYSRHSCLFIVADSVVVLWAESILRSISGICESSIDFWHSFLISFVENLGKTSLTSLPLSLFFFVSVSPKHFSPSWTNKTSKKKNIVKRLLHCAKAN